MESKLCIKYFVYDCSTKIKNHKFLRISYYFERIFLNIDISPIYY